MSDQQSQEPKVYITGLPVQISNDDLRKDFQKFGQITDVYVKQKDTFAFAFITYGSMSEAQDAIQQMNGKQIKGKRVKLDLAKPRNNNNRGFTGAPRDNNIFRGRGGDRQQSGSRACFKCNEQGHFARECPNSDKRGVNDNRGGNYNSSRNRQQSPSPQRQSRKKSDSRSNSPQKKHQKKSKSVSRSPQKRIARKKSSSHSRSRSPAKNKHQKKRSFSRSSSLKKEKESRSRSRSIDNKNKRRTVKRRSPSPSSRSRS